MIFLGQNDTGKNDIILKFCKENNIRKVFILSPNQYYFECSFENHEFIEYADIIQYVFYYRLLQEIDSGVLVVVNECLQKKNRNDLTYNCIRNFLNQTDNHIVFNYLPIIESSNDFFILFDFDTRSQWKRETDFSLLNNSNINQKQIRVRFKAINIHTENQLKSKYARKKEALINNIGLKDPHTIPRNLYLLSGEAKVKVLDSNKLYLGRNNRFGLENIETYSDCTYKSRYIIFEFCHNHINFCNFLAMSKQTDFDVLITDLKTDQWYFERYLAWANDLEATYAKIRQN